LIRIGPDLQEGQWNYIIFSSITLLHATVRFK
jgi:hypothetical protein